jgi:membrane fusion protein, multidrug efflux system
MTYKLRLILITLLFSVLASMAGCVNQQSANAQENQKEKEAIPVEAVTVIRGNVSAYFTGTASLEAENEARVVAKASGVVEKIFVEEGLPIKSGQIMAQLDDEKASLDLAEAKAQLRQLENDFKRKKELYGKKIISTEIFEKARSDYEMQKARVGQSQLSKDYTAIRAPIDGVVAERLIKKGNMVPVNEPCFSISDFDPLLAILHVPEKELFKLKANLESKLSVDALPNKIFSGKILRISPIVDPQSGTFKVTVAVTDNEGLLKPGMFARVRIVHDVHTNTLLLPKDAVLTEGNESVVFKINPEDNTVKRLVVKIGYINTTHLEILSGLNHGDSVVQTGIGGLKDGSKIEILESAGSSPVTPDKQVHITMSQYRL